MELFASYTGSDFLLFYAVMLLTCVGLGVWIPANLRPQGRRGEVEDMDEVAVLVGGSERYTTSILADLFARGGLTEGASSRLMVQNSGIEAQPGANAVLRMDDEFRVKDVRNVLNGHAEIIEDRLIAAGLLMDPSERTKLRWISALPYAVLFAIGLYRYLAGSALGEPTGFLMGLLIITAALVLFRLAKVNPRTMAGEETVRRLEERSTRLRSAPQATEAGYAVAIFGTGVLVGTPWEPVHAARQAASGSDSSGGCGSDGGGGGGCGGGCGGCGG